jgi:AcrR family transcriptional regulator
LTVEATEPDGRRAIGHRNREAILDGALEVISRDPDAAMNTIADGTGLGRATLYRHFPTREDLLAALRERARERGRAAMVAARPDEGDPLEALERIVAALSDVVTDNRVLFRVIRDGKPSHADRQRFFAPVTKIFERAQRDGIIDPGVKAAWLTTVTRGLIGIAAEEVEAGRLRRADAPRRIVRQLVDGARAR